MSCPAPSPPIGRIDRATCGSITARELMRCSGEYATTEVAEEALRDLAKARSGKWELLKPERGRPTSRFVLLDSDTTPPEAEETMGCVNVKDVETMQSVEESTIQGTNEGSK